MLTPQEVSTHAFSKAVMGGYNMAMVDEFLDELTDDYTALYKENAALKSKMKVLVKKVEDYRATEDSMRATLLTAQKMADSIVHEAEAKRDELVAKAEAEAHARLEELRRELQEAEDRLRQGQEELSRFITQSRDLCAKQMQFLDQLPKAPVSVSAAPAKEEPPVQEIEERVMAAFAEQDQGEVPAEEGAESGEPAEETSALDYPEGDPFARDDGDLDATRRINLDDLKFGRNYSGD